MREIRSFAMCGKLRSCRFRSICWKVCSLSVCILSWSGMYCAEVTTMLTHTYFMTVIDCVFCLRIGAVHRSGPHFNRHAWVEWDYDAALMPKLNFLHMHDRNLFRYHQRITEMMQDPQFFAGCRISSWAAKFAFFCGILIFPWNFTEFYRS